MISILELLISSDYWACLFSIVKVKHNFSR